MLKIDCIWRLFLILIFTINIRREIFSNSLKVLIISIELNLFVFVSFLWFWQIGAVSWWNYQKLVQPNTNINCKIWTFEKVSKTNKHIWLSYSSQKYAHYGWGNLASAKVLEGPVQFACLKRPDLMWKKRFFPYNNNLIFLFHRTNHNEQIAHFLVFYDHWFSIKLFQNLGQLDSF